MIAAIAIAALGAAAMAIALIEGLAGLFDSLRSARNVVRKAFGRKVGEESELDQAMQWIQVFGLFLAGGALLAAGISIGSS